MSQHISHSISFNTPEEELYSFLQDIPMLFDHETESFDSSLSSCGLPAPNHASIPSLLHSVYPSIDSGMESYVPSHLTAHHHSRKRSWRTCQDIPSNSSSFDLRSIPSTLPLFMNYNHIDSISSKKHDITSTSTILTNTSKNQTQDKILLDYRIKTFLILMDMYNLDGDFALYRACHRYFHTDVQVTYKISNKPLLVGCHPNAVFSFLYLSHELFPDGIGQVLDHRVIPCPDKQDLIQIEYIYKFIGTNISTESLYDVYQRYQQMIPSYSMNDTCREYTYDDLTNNLLHCLGMNYQSFLIHKPFVLSTCIFSCLLSFSCVNNLIVAYDIELLATN